jgi:hypothetical protein
MRVPCWLKRLLSHAHCNRLWQMPAMDRHFAMSMAPCVPGPGSQARPPWCGTVSLAMPPWGRGGMGQGTLAAARHNMVAQAMAPSRDTSHGALTRHKPWRPHATQAMAPSAMLASYFCWPIRMMHQRRHTCAGLFATLFSASAMVASCPSFLTMVA